MKTKLPEKILSSIKFYPTCGGVRERSVTAGEVANTVNKLIDYITELTKIVEGKQDNFVDVRGHSTTGNPVGHVPNFTVSTPTLKEQLLGEIVKRRKNYGSYQRGHYVLDNQNIDSYNQALEDVEAIINRKIK